MQARKLVRVLPLGLLAIAVMLGTAAIFHFIDRARRPPSTPPREGSTHTGEEATKRHPRLPPVPIDRSAFAKLPPECGCTLTSGRVQLWMHVTGQQQTITPDGSAVHVLHDVAVAKELDGGDQLMKFPAFDDAAPGPRTEGFAARFALACQGDRLIVADAVRVTMWDLQKTPRRMWSTALPARRGEVATGTSLAIECEAAQIEDQVIVIDPAGAKARLRLADGALER